MKAVSDIKDPELRIVNSVQLEDEKTCSYALCVASRT